MLPPRSRGSDNAEGFRGSSMQLITGESSFLCFQARPRTEFLPLSHRSARSTGEKSVPINIRRCLDIFLVPVPFIVRTRSLSLLSIAIGAQYNAPLRPERRWNEPFIAARCSWMLLPFSGPHRPPSLYPPYPSPLPTISLFRSSWLDILDDLDAHLLDIARKRSLHLLDRYSRWYPSVSLILFLNAATDKFPSYFRGTGWLVPFKNICWRFGGRYFDAFVIVHEICGFGSFIL